MGPNNGKSIAADKSKPPVWSIRGRGINKQDRDLFQIKPRSFNCLLNSCGGFLDTKPLDHNVIRKILDSNCATIEHQIIALRDCIQLRREDYNRRYAFTQRLLTCLYRHHNVFYQGILFGSTVNGLGFRDSDVDLRLRPLVLKSEGTYEPVTLDDDTVDRVLRNIAHQTTRCSPAYNEFVPSSRCPIAKLIFVQPSSLDLRNAHTLERALSRSNLQDSLKYDISLSTSNPLSSFNSLLLRFLSDLEPKFHLLATAIRYWSTSHELIVPGHLSSYALVNMLIYFCQTLNPPLLPTIDHMRDLYFKHCLEDEKNGEPCTTSLTDIEWQCIVCLRKEFYKPSANTEPLSVLLLKFFEFYLNFPYSTHIITIRTGRALEHKEFLNSRQYDKRFSMKQFINIQDPFDLKHNLTAGIQGQYFRYFITKLRYSYERLFQELLNNFKNTKQNVKGGSGQVVKQDSKSWGLNVLFTKITPKELDNAT